MFDIRHNAHTLHMCLKENVSFASGGLSSIPRTRPFAHSTPALLPGGLDDHRILVLGEVLYLAQGNGVRGRVQHQCLTGVQVRAKVQVMRLVRDVGEGRGWVRFESTIEITALRNGEWAMRLQVGGGIWEMEFSARYPAALRTPDAQLPKLNFFPKSFVSVERKCH